MILCVCVLYAVWLHFHGYICILDIIITFIFLCVKDMCECCTLWSLWNELEIYSYGFSFSQFVSTGLWIIIDLGFVVKHTVVQGFVLFFFIWVYVCRCFYLPIHWMQKAYFSCSLTFSLLIVLCELLLCASNSGSG